ncbi:MAG: SdpI family protein [Bacteroidota bacterium]
MNWIQWLIGPQLIGMVFLLVGFIQKKFPPKKINNLYGYRSPAAQKNQQTWDEANRYSAIRMIKTGAFLVLAGLVITLLLQVIPMPAKIKIAIFFLVIIASAMGSAISMMTATERHLEKTFDDKQE